MMVGSKMFMLKHFRHFLILASLLRGAGNPRVFGIPWGWGGSGKQSPIEVVELGMQLVNVLCPDN